MESNNEFRKKIAKYNELRSLNTKIRYKNQLGSILRICYVLREDRLALAAE
jgi:hypothetical protein